MKMCCVKRVKLRVNPYVFVNLQRFWGQSQKSERCEESAHPGVRLALHFWEVLWGSICLPLPPLPHTSKSYHPGTHSPGLAKRGAPTPGGVRDARVLG